MNIENIAALGDQLQAMGFADAGNSLVKRICLMPQNFVIKQTIEKGNDQISFQLFFERSDKQGVYTLAYYDASFQREASFGATTINGIGIADLEKQMAGIDWKKVFDFAEKKRWTPNDRTSWENEQKVETIISSLAAMEMTEEGKSVSAILKTKYWTGAAYYEMFGNISQTKSKVEISQRFYCSEGQPGISVDEAYRFLQNRRLEKQLTAKRRQTDNQIDEEQLQDDSSSKGSGLLKKRRLNGGARTKKTKVTSQ
jgi:hypothetical protein